MNNQFPIRIQWLTIACAFALSLAACTDDDELATKDSDEVGTYETFVFFSVTGRATGPVSANVQLREGGASGVPLELKGGDSLWFSSGQSVTNYHASDNLAEALAQTAERVDRMERRNDVDFEFLFLKFDIPDTPYYTASLDQVSENRYYLGYLRGDKPDATGSYVSLPATFQITAPLANEVVSRANDIVVNWQPGDDPDVYEVGVHAALVCDRDTVDSFRDDLDADTGTYTIPGGTLDYPAGRQCPLSIEVTKQRRGTLGPNLRGEVTGQRVATVTVSSID